MSNKINLKVTLTGAAGRIAYSLIPLLMNGQAFGDNHLITLALLDIAPCISKLEGIRMEIEDSCFVNSAGVLVTSDADYAFDDADVAIIVGGFPRLPGMERRDLIEKNIEIMRSMGASIERKAKKTVKVLVVANPANTNCLVCMSSAPSIPKTNFSCLTRLDHERLRTSLASKLKEISSDTYSNVIPSSVKSVCILGNHSVTQVPYLGVAQVQINDIWVPVSTIVPNSLNFSESIITQVQNRGAEIIKAQQASSALSAASAIAKHLHDWVGPLKDNYGKIPTTTVPDDQPVSDFFSMGIYSNGNPYDIPSGLVFSFPCIRTGIDTEVQIVEGLPMDADVKQRLERTVRELIEERGECESILGYTLG